MAKTLPRIYDNFKDQLDKALNYELTANSVKDSKLTFSKTDGFHIDSDGWLNISATLAVRAYYDDEGYKATVRRFYPRFRFRIKFTTSED